MEFLETLRGWDRQPTCIRCSDSDVYKMRSRGGVRNTRFLWRCRACDSQYTVRAATVFEDSRVALRHWCVVLHAACANRAGISTTEISRRTGVSNTTALFMIDRIRWALGSIERHQEDEGVGADPADSADRLNLNGHWLTAIRKALESRHPERG